MEEHLWSTMQEDIAKFRNNINNRRRVPSLEDLCLKSIATNIGFFCNDFIRCSMSDDLVNYLQENRKDGQPLSPVSKLLETVDKSSCSYALKDSPFMILPRTLLRQVHQTLQQKGLADRSIVLPLLINENMQMLYLSTDELSSTWSKLDFATLLVRVMETSRNLIHFELVLGDKYLTVSERTLGDLLYHMNNLQHLDISFFNEGLFDDSVLKVIGEHCPNLRELILLNHGGSQSEHYFSDTGLTYLWDHEAPLGQCTKLTTLAVGECPFVSTSAWVNALIKLPNLRSFNVMHRTVIILMKYVTNFMERKLKLQHLFLHTADCITINESTFNYIFTVLPNLSQVNGDIEYVRKIVHNLVHYSQLNVKLISKKSSVDTITSCLTQINTRITSLKLKLFEELDFSIIGNYCPNLQSLNIQMQCGNFAVTNEYNLEPYNCFTQLEQLTLCVIIHPHFPMSILKCLLVSGHLKVFKYCAQYFPMEIVDWLLEQSRFHPEIFSNVTHIHLQTRLPVTSILKLVCISPNLEEIKVHNKASQLALQYYMRSYDMECNFKIIESFSC